MDAATLIVNASVFLSAVVLGTLGWRAAKSQASAARQQAQEAQRATYMAHQPRLVPLHEAANTLPPEPRPGFPADDETPNHPQQQAIRVFRIANERQQWRAALHVRNVGQGSAKIIHLRLSSANGYVYEGERGFVIGAGDATVLLLELEEERGLGPSIAEWQAVIERWGIRWPPEEWKELADPPPFAQGMSRLFFLEIDYEDLFAGPGMYQLRAWFDPRGHGLWKIALEEQSPGRESLRGTG